MFSLFDVLLLCGVSKLVDLVYFVHNVQHLYVRLECVKCVRAIPQGSHSVLTQAFGDFCWSWIWMKKLAKTKKQSNMHICHVMP